MNTKSFSDKLSWRIIGLVLVISLVSQVVASLVVAVHVEDWWDESPEMLVYLNVIGLASLVVLFFVSRVVINRMTRYSQELETTTADKERMESELTMARGIQRGMLSTGFPPFLYALLNPAKEVGGDLYDFDLKGDQLYFAIGDVSGKGVPASLVMAITSATLHLVMEMDSTLNDTLRRVNDGFSKNNNSGMFVTLFVARLNLKTGHMDYCNAGHTPVIIIPPDGEPYFLKSKPNIALGLCEHFSFEAEQMDLEPGSRIIAYTDGVTEAEREDLSQYGDERLVSWARHLAKTHPNASSPTEKSIVESLYQSVRDFTEDNPQNDDVTIMSIKLPVYD